MPKSASYRLLDIVGLDVWEHVTKNLYEAVPERSVARALSSLAPFLSEMIRARMARRQDAARASTSASAKDREIHALDRKTLEYHPADKPRFASLETVRKIEPLGERLKALVALDDRAGRFLWQAAQRSYPSTAADMVPEISDRIVEIDRAMRWGYANALGPFELWDALGFEATARRIAERRPRTAAEACERMLAPARSRSIAPPMRGAIRAPNTSICVHGELRELETAPRHHWCWPI